MNETIKYKEVFYTSTSYKIIKCLFLKMYKISYTMGRYLLPKISLFLCRLADDIKNKFIVYFYPVRGTFLLDSITKDHAEKPKNLVVVLLYYYICLYVRDQS